MKPYQQIFPDAQLPTVTLELARKSGRLPKGRYGYLECYCIEPGCDCRRVTLLVFNEKMRPKAVICFGFDGEGPFAGPYLDCSSYQAPYASDLLDFFVHTLNARPDWLLRMYRQYREVRELVDREPYRGRDFPEPGDLLYRVMPPPDLEAVLQESLKPGSHPNPHGVRTAGEGGGAPSVLGTEPGGMAHFVELYARAGAGAPLGIILALQDELHRQLLAHPAAVEELASLLPALYRQSPEADEQIAAALRVLRDTLDFYRVEVEGGRPGARQQMQRLQSALLRRVYLESADPDLRLALDDILAGSGAKLIPELLRASTGSRAADLGPGDLQEQQAEDFIPGITRHFAAIGLTSPFDGAGAILELFEVTDPNLHPGLTREMLVSEDPLLREIASLMLFHPDPGFALEVSRMLVSVAGSSITPDTLRRLIVSRNWFPEAIKRHVDCAIGNARKARVECAHLAAPRTETVYATCIDGSGGQMFHVLVPDGAGFAGCSLLLRQGEGVAHCSIARLESSRDVNTFLAAARSLRCCVESSGDYLDLRICQALADGAAQGKSPDHRLVDIAELLGRDHWRAVQLDAGQELVQLRSVAGGSSAPLPEHPGQRAALEESATWHRHRAMFGSWIEAGEPVAREIEAVRAGRKSIKTADAIEGLLAHVLEPRRAVWLERLVINTLWLQHAREVTIAWQWMYQVARAVADQSIPLKEIPLMVSIAKQTLAACKRTAQKAENEKMGESA